VGVKYVKELWLLERRHARKANHMALNQLASQHRADVRPQLVTNNEAEAHETWDPSGDWDQRRAYKRVLDEHIAHERSKPR